MITQQHEIAIVNIAKRGYLYSNLNTYVCAYYEDKCITKTFEKPLCMVTSDKHGYLLKIKDNKVIPTRINIRVIGKAEAYFNIKKIYVNTFFDVVTCDKLRVFVATGHITNPDNFKNALYSRFLFALKSLIHFNEDAIKNLRNLNRYYKYYYDEDYIPNWLKQIIECAFFRMTLTQPETERIQLPDGINYLLGIINNDTINSKFCCTIAGILNKYYSGISHLCDIENIIRIMETMDENHNGMFIRLEEISYCTYILDIPLDIIELIYDTCSFYYF